MTEHFEFQVGPAEAGRRLDLFLAAQPELGLSRSQVQRLIDAGHAAVNGQRAKRGWKVEAGDAVTLTVPPPEPTTLEPEAIPLDVVYEDEDLLVVNKPRGLVVHPAAGHWSGTLVNAILGRLHLDRFQAVQEDQPGTGVGATGGESGGQGSQEAGSDDALDGDEDLESDGSLGSDGGEAALRPGIVHRLDKDTTGLLVVARHPAAQRHLAAQIRDRVARREYLALIHGDPGVGAGRIEAPIGRHPTDRKRMAVLPQGGREAVTHFRVVERLGDFTLVQCRLETGRTHQIRVHLAYIGHPVAGDPVYGPRKQALELGGQALHAFRLGFYHPRSGEWQQFEAPLPPDFAAVLAQLRSS